MLMYFGDLKKEALSFSSLGEMTLVVVKPDFKAFQAPTVGEVTPCTLSLFALSLSLSPYSLLELWLTKYELWLSFLTS